MVVDKIIHLALIGRERNKCHGGKREGEREGRRGKERKKEKEKMEREGKRNRKTRKRKENGRVEESPLDLPLLLLIIIPTVARRERRR